jgi:L-erythrulose 1-phosphate isomerase
MAQKSFWIGTSWKMNKLRAEAISFAKDLKSDRIGQTKPTQVFVVPPFPYITDVANILRDTNILVGAQNMHWADQGAWTGEVSAPMLRDCGARLVEIGHSERRTYFGETDEYVGKKTAAALNHGLIPLVCIGDTRSEYEAGTTDAVLERQVHYALQGTSRENARKVVFAYEPVWSIGEGSVPADPDFVNKQHSKLKHLTANIAGEPLRILYGGSVNPENCVTLASRSHIDGLFIGRSAWNVEGFVNIINKVEAAQL